MNKVFLISLITLLLVSYPVNALSFQDVTRFFASIFNSIASFFNSAFGVLTPSPTVGGGGGGGGGGGISTLCSSLLFLSITGKDTCTVTATVTASNCANRTYEIKDEGSKCSGSITVSSFTKTCTWTVTSDAYTYDLYIDGEYKLSKSVSCSKTPPPTCSDGTPYSSCSLNKPKYCNNGNLVNNCTKCGCPSGQICNTISEVCYISGGGGGGGGGGGSVSKCSDGTAYDSCSSAIPLYCNNGNLVNKCSQCGCTSGQSCNSTTDSCYTPQTCSDGTLYSQCSSTKPKYCSNETLIDSCTQCGCSSGQNCNTTTNSCYTPPVTLSPLHVDGNKIKDANGKTVYIRGVNYFLYTGTHGKVWLTSSGSSTGTDSDWDTQVVPAIIQNFDKMRSFNLNCFRMHTSPQDWLQTSDFIPHMQQIASLASERGIYVIFDLYGVADTYPDSTSMPYPPYTSAASTALISNSQAFVDLWGTIANAMKNNSNVMFELYNEPFGNYKTDPNWFQNDFNSMLNAYQQCIAKIRTITNQTIIVMWGFQIGVDLSGPYTWAPTVRMSVLADDPRVQGINIAYSFHWYEDNPQDHQVPVNNVSSLTTYLNWSQIDDVSTRKPVLATELGGLVGNPFALTWMTNGIDLLYARGVGFIDWVWSAPFMANHGDEIIATASNFQLTDKGVIFTQKTMQLK